VEDDLEEEVPELLAEERIVGGVDRLQHLVGFLDEVRLEGVVRLLAVPRAAPRSAQPLHDRHEVGKRLAAPSGFAHGQRT